MAGKIQQLTIILAISISVVYGKSAQKIVRGQNALAGEFPHQVSLQDKNGFHFCGGSIIDARLILTAAHCVVGQNIRNQDIYVIVGTNDRKYHTSNNRYLVAKRVIHNFMPENSLLNDIAILQLEKPIVFTNSTRPAKLPYSNILAGTHVMSSGWGATAYDDQTGEGYNYPQYLQKLDRTVVSQQECQSIIGYGTNISPGHLCVWSPNYTGICFGDSGSPLTYEGFVIGVASFVMGCAKNYPDVYTNVYHYVEWIQTVAWYMNNNYALPNYGGDVTEV